MKNFREGVTFLSLLYCSSLVVQTWATKEIPVQRGGSVTLDCGFETTVTGRPLQWVTISTGKEPYLFAYSWEGASGCSEDDRCTLHPNGSLELQDITPEDVDRMYRCQIGDGENYEYYSDHRMKVLVETCPSIKLLTATSAKGFKIDEQVMFAYTEPICEDNEDGNYRATCYPPPGILMDGDYENIQCSCRPTDSACLTDRLNISIAIVQTWAAREIPVQSGGSVTLDCGFETTVRGRPLQWVTISPGNEPKEFAYSLEGALRCSEDNRCTLHPNGSLELQDISLEDVDRMYRCQIGDGENYEYYSDHRLKVLVGTKMLKEKMQPLGIGLIIIAVVVVVAVAVFATYYITLRCHNKNKKRTASSQESGVPNSTNNTLQVTQRANEIEAVQPTDETTAACPEQDERPVKDEVDSGNNRASASPVKPHPVQTSVCGDPEMDETSFNGRVQEEEPLLDSNDQNEVLTKPPAGDTKETTEVQRTVSLKDKKTVRPHADNGPKRPCIEYRILDESKGERSFCFQFELKKPGVHLVLSTRREELSPSKYEIYFDEGKIRTSTKGKEGESFPCGCGKFSMIMEGEELSLSILDEDEGWIPLHTWEEQVYLNQCCSIAVFNMKFLQVEKCRRLTEFENPTSRTLSLHPKRE